MNRFLVLLPMLVPALPAPAEDPAAEVAAAERAFAARASAASTKTAFLEYLAPDSLMFRPEPVNGLEWWKDRPERPGKLLWGPERVVAAGSGELALSSGPWRFLDAEGKAVAFGHFATIWQRQKDGRWKARLDTGVGHDELPVPDELAPVLTFRPAEAGRKRAPAPSRPESALKGVEDWARQFHDEGRLLLDERLPARGVAALRAAFADGAPVLTPKGGGLAKSGDFLWRWGAYTLARGANAEKGYYLMVWIRTGAGWKIVSAVFSPTPPPPPAPAPVPEPKPAPDANPATTPSP